MRVLVYVDGFNLYYGALRRTPYRWLDISKLCKKLLKPTDTIVKIKYFTAEVKALPHDPDQPLRQQIYLRALRTIPNLKIVLGHYQVHSSSLLLPQSQPGRPQYVRGLKAEEKKTDVNMAVRMIEDGHDNHYDVAIVITNDGDLEDALRYVTQRLDLKVGIFNPIPKHTSKALMKYASFIKTIQPRALKKSLFPEKLEDNKGIFYKPKSW